MQCRIFLCSFVHMLFHWKKTKQLNNRADPLAQPRGPPRVRGPPFEKHCTNWKPMDTEQSE
jgi:hypothetical protein